MEETVKTQIPSRYILINNCQYKPDNDENREELMKMQIKNNLLASKRDIQKRFVNIQNMGKFHTSTK
jgi:hypothetical protein